MSKVLYADNVWRRTVIFYIKMGSWIQICKPLSNTLLIMLERTMYLAIILLSVKYWFQNNWSHSMHNAKVQTVN